MDFVNKAYAQIADLFRSMTPGTRIAAGLLLAVVVISLIYLFQYQAAGGDEYLLDGRPFSSSEMTAIETAFAQAGLKQSTIVGSRIRIPRGKKDVYLAALAESSALPADFSKYLDEAVASDSPFASSRSLELKRWNAKQKELALIISRIRGIQTATVQYDEETKHGLSRTKHKTAMVAVQSEGGSLDSDQIKAIKNVIASAYAGMDRQNITITDMTSGLSFGGALGPGGLSEDDSLYASHKQRYERDWKSKIVDQLSMIPGVVVGVNVELSPQTKKTTQTVKIDAKPVTISTSEFEKDSSTQPANPAGRPGAAPNGVGNQPVAVTTTTSGAETQANERRSEAQSVPGHEHVLEENAPLLPVSASAAIEVPASYYTRVWKVRNPAAAGQPEKAPDQVEITKIQLETKAWIEETVRNLLPKVEQGTNPYPHITVATYTDFPSTVAAEPTTMAQASTWFADNWRTLTMVAVGLVCLAILRSMVRSTAAAGPAAPVAAAVETGPRIAQVEEPLDDDSPEPAAALRRRFKSGDGTDLKAELRELVKENPDAAATILKSWIGEAA